MELTKEQFKGMIGEEIGKLLEEKLKAAIEPIEKKILIAEHGEKKVEESIKAAKFFCALIQNDHTALKAITSPMVTGSGSGSYVVPTPMGAEILCRIYEGSVALKEARRITMASETLKWPVKDWSKATPACDWVDQGSEKPATECPLTYVQLTLTKKAGYCVITAELEESSIVDIVQYIYDELAEDIYMNIDAGVFAGTGTPWTGLLNDTGIQSVVMSSGSVLNVGYDELIDLQSAIRSPLLSGAKYYMHRSILGVVRKVKDLNDRPIFIEPVSGAGVKANGDGTLLGYPVRLVESMPAATDDAGSTGFIIFGNLRKGVMIGEKSNDVSMRASREATVTINGSSVSCFTNNLIALLAEKRVAYARACPVGIARLVTGADS